MRPIRLTMSAFGSYAGEEVVDFSGMEQGIFLVTGDTGAGKTTIFDGIVYALYDRTSGGVRDGNMMRSAYADLRTPTFVELVFRCRGEEYRVVRNPDYERESLRKDKDGNPKKTQEKTKVELFLPDGTAFRGNKKEINQKIEELLGLDARQFMQVAMIAQGDFLKLLHAKSEERKEIFSRIFDTGIYGRLQDELRRREKESYVRLKEKEQAVGEQMNRILCLSQWEYEEELSRACESGNLAEAVRLLTLLNKEGSHRIKELSALKDEKNQALTHASKIQELASRILSLREKRRQQEQWLKENLSKESEYKAREQKAAKALADKEEELRSLKTSQEKEEREYREQEKGLREKLQEMEGLKKLWKEAIDALKAQKEAANTWESANTAYHRKREAYEEMYDAFFREQAGILAQGLKKGMPCPVCGSTSHPAKAFVSENAPDQEQVRTAKEAVGKAEKSREKAQQRHQAASQTYQTALGSLNQEGGRLFGTEFHAGEDTWRSRAARSMDEAREALDVCRERYQERNRDLQKQEAVLKKEVEACRREAGSAREAVDDFIRQTERIQGEVKAAREQEELLCEEWGAVRLKEGTEGKVQDVAGDMFPEDDVLSEQVQLSEAVLDTLREEKKKLEHSYQECYSTQQSNIKTLEVLKQYQKEYHKLREEYTMVRHLSQTAGGNLPGTAKIDFESYIQRQYFERVIHRANQRLMQMSGGQFLLKCRDLDQLANRGKVGLDLDVYSLVTESVRDVKTLSGGESFMAALSMALGLADVIQDSAGAIRLDTMFIDEGFGSLDENAREQAIRVLYELAGENRLIGIISHVNELKEQIEPKLSVNKTKTGSRAAWLR